MQAQWLRALTTRQHSITVVRRRKDVHLAELARRRGVIAKTTNQEDGMHPTIIMALAEQRIADWTRVQPTAKRQRRLRRRPRLVWAAR